MPNATPDSTPRRRMRNRVVFFLKCLLALWVLGYLAESELLNAATVARLFRPDPRLLLIAGLGGALIALGAWRWCRLLHAQRLPARFRDCLPPCYIGAALNNFLPGGVGGDVVRLAYVLKHFTHARAGGVTSLLADRAIGLLGMLALVLAIFVLHAPALTALQPVMTVVYLGAGAAGACAAALALFLLLPRRMSLPARLERAMHSHRWSRLLLSLLDVLRRYREAPGILCEAFFISIACQAAIGGMLYFIAGMLGYSIAPWQIMLASGVAQIANLLPVTPGGIGVGEAAFAGVLSLLTGPGATGLAGIMIGYRIILVLITLPAFAVYMKQKGA